jgi:hypothetical protein
MAGRGRIAAHQLPITYVVLVALRNADWLHRPQRMKELEETQACFIAYRDRLKSEMDLLAANPAGVLQRAAGSSAIADARADPGHG